MTTNNKPNHYLPESRSKIVYNTVLNCIKNRLTQPGEIRTADAWALAGKFYSYFVIGLVFRSIMEAMIAENKAYKVKAGCYIIGNPPEIKTIIHQTAGGIEIEMTAGFEFQAIPLATELPASVITGERPAPRHVAPWYSKVYDCYMFVQ